MCSSWLTDDGSDKGVRSRAVASAQDLNEYSTPSGRLQTSTLRLGEPASLPVVPRLQGLREMP